MENAKSVKKLDKAKEYEEKTRSDLYEIAKKLDVDGRSKMDKDQLIEALLEL